MSRAGRGIVGILAAAALAIGLASIARADPSSDRPFAIPLPGGLRLPEKGIQPSLKPPDPTSPTIAPDRPRRIVVQFKERPTPTELAVLESAGIEILERVHDRSYFVLLPAQFDLEAALQHPAVQDRVRAVFAIDARDKVARALRGPTFPPFVIADRAQDLRRATLVFHRRAFATRAEAQTWLSGKVRSFRAFDPPRIWIVVASPAQFDALAEEPETEWIRLPPVRRVPLIDRIRDVAGVDAIHQFELASTDPAYGGDTGDGVSIAVFDCPPTTGPDGRFHPDLDEWDAAAAPPATRVATDSGSPPPACDDGDTHGDEVIGLAIGSGKRSADVSLSLTGPALSPWQLRAIAPSSTVTVFSDSPAAASVDLLLRATKNLPIGNHSHVTGPLIYDDYSRLLDRAALGFPDDAGSPVGTRQTVVVAAGNSGAAADPQLSDINCSNAQGYFSILGPSKNAITVGAAFYGDDVVGSASRASLSSMGPTLDGRLKPDLIAPACRLDTSESSGVNKVKGPYVLHTADGTYTGLSLCGTSLAAPVVSGVVALYHEEWARRAYTEDLTPATVRAVLAQSALDMIAERGSSPDPGTVFETGRSAGYPMGPDYATGFGLFRADVGLDSIANRQWSQGEVKHGETWELDIEVDEADVTAGLRVALAWDDPGEVGLTVVSPAVLHDLDLAVLSPPAPDGTRDVFGAWVPPEVHWMAGTASIALDDPESGVSAVDCDPSYDGLDKLALVEASDTDSWDEEPFDLPAAGRCRGRASYGASPADWVDVESGDAVEPEECRDVRNNIERVDVDTITQGVWTIRVTGTSIPTSTTGQPFAVSWSVGTQPFTTEFVSDRRCYSMEGFAGHAGERWRPAAFGSCFFFGIDELCERDPTLALCSLRCGLDPCPPVRVNFPEWPWAARVGIFDSTGNAITEDRRAFRHLKKLDFVPRKAGEYYVVAFTEDGRPLDAKARRRGFRFDEATIERVPPPRPWGRRPRKSGVRQENDPPVP